MIASDDGDAGVSPERIEGPVSRAGPPTGAPGAAHAPGGVVPLPAGFRERVDLVVWDFDQTILAIHSYALRIEAEDVPRRNLYEDFAHLDFFCAVVRALVAADVKVAVASFGKFEVIHAYLERAFGEVLFHRDNICTPSQVGSRDGFSLRGGKNLQLKKLLGDYGITDRFRVLFFDGALLDHWASAVGERDLYRERERESGRGRSEGMWGSADAEEGCDVAGRGPVERRLRCGPFRRSPRLKTRMWG